VVAIAGKPNCCIIRAVPTSQGLGITKQPVSCMARNLFRLSMVADISTSLDERTN
jgi:hypothetical protein